MGASLRFCTVRLRLVPGWLLWTWLLFLPATAESQTASLRGQVFDPSGAVVPRATITLRGPSGEPKTATADDHGSYLFTALPPGSYTVQATVPKLEQSPVAITLKPGAQTLRLDLKIAVTQQQTTVQEEGADSRLSTESASNASALVLRGQDLQALADDPEDLATDLQALAGPSAGPGGSSVFIDGFSGGQLPSKEAIREIRINHTNLQSNDE